MKTYDQHGERVTRVRIHPDSCDCDQPWYHQPPAAERIQIRKDAEALRAAFRAKAKRRMNAQRLARARGLRDRPTGDDDRPTTEPDPNEQYPPRRHVACSASWPPPAAPR